jgi:hypothetical protein
LGFTAKFIVEANAGFAGASTTTRYREFGASIGGNDFDAKPENVAGIADGAFATVCSTAICPAFFVGTVRHTAPHALSIGGAELTGGADSTEVATSIRSTKFFVTKGFACVLFAEAFRGTEISGRANAADISTAVRSAYFVRAVWRTGGLADAVSIANLVL